MLGALDLLFALGRDDLRVVWYRCVSVWQDHPLLEPLGLLSDFQVPVVDTEVDPPQQNSRPIRLRIVSPR